MRVAKYYSNNDVRIEEMPKPEIGRGEFLLKTKACGICGSDVMEWYRIKKAPLVLGHEATGEIVEIDAAVSQYKKGDRVFVAHHVPCNKCWYCLSGNHTVCQTLHTTNFYPGGFSEYIRVPQVNVNFGTFILPKEISFVEGTLIEPLACVVRGQRKAQLKAGQSVLILGAGISGLLHLLLAKAKGAGRIIVTDINEFRLNTARKFGADGAIRASRDIAKVLRKINDNRLADLVVVCTQATSAFTQALKSVDRAGTILCFAPTEPGVTLPIPVNDFWRNNVSIVHSYGASGLDTAVAIELIRGKRIAVGELITHRLKLNEAAIGFRLVAQATRALKVAIEL